MNTNRKNRRSWHSLSTPVLCVGLLLASGCATAALSQQGMQVQMIQELEREDCANLGPVFGKGGGSFGGAWISDENLMEYAANDLRNKAAQKGATHVVFSSHQMGHTSGKSGGATSTATFTGVAYRCPPNVPPPPAATATTAAPESASAADGASDDAEPAEASDVAPSAEEPALPADAPDDRE